MKKVFITLMALVMLCSMAIIPVGAATDNNIIGNGSMEAFDVVNQIPEPFLMWSEDSALSFGADMGAQVVDDVSHSGNISIRISPTKANKYTVFFQSFEMGAPIDKDQTYVLTAWVKTSLTSATTGVRLFAQYLSGGQTGTVSAGQYQSTGTVKATADWTKLTFELKPSAATGWVDTVSNAVFGIQINAAGQVWVDDLTLTKKGDPIPDYSTIAKTSSVASVAVSSTVKSSVASATSSAANVSSTQVTSSEESSSAVSSTVSSATTSNGSGSLNPIIFIIIALVVIIAGCGAAYFFIFKKKA